jgi:hypothetical protein
MAEADNRFGPPYFPGDMAINYEEGQPGSFFTISGTGFQPDSHVALIINGHEVATEIPIDSSGNFSAILDTSRATRGDYAVTVLPRSRNPLEVQFILDPAAPFRRKEGAGLIIALPPGIAKAEYLFLPTIFYQK